MIDATQSKSNSPAADWPSEGLEHLSRCPVCGSPERTLLHPELVDGIFFCAPGRWQMYRCAKCACGYLDPRPTPETIGLAYASYYTHAATANQRWISDASFLGRRLPSWRNGYLNHRFPHLNRRPSSAAGAYLAKGFRYSRILAERDVRHLPAPGPGARLLDIGCGDGNFLRIASSLGYRAEGLEFDPAAVAAARSGGLTVHQGGLPETGLPHSTYDAVTLSQVIEHLHDPRSALVECLRLLKPGGFFWLATPNLNALGHSRAGPHWRGLEPPRHLVVFSPDALLATCRNSGFLNPELRAIGPVSAWFLNASRKISTGQQSDGHASPSFSEHLAALRMDFAALRNPRVGEELIVVATRPPD